MTMNEMIDDLIDEEQKSISDYERLKCVRALDTFELYCITRHNRVLLCLKELKSHRAAWDKVISEIDQQYDGIRPYDIHCAEGLEMAWDIVDLYRPKKGENE